MAMGSRYNLCPSMRQTLFAAYCKNLYRLMLTYATIWSCVLRTATFVVKDYSGRHAPAVNTFVLGRQEFCRGYVLLVVAGDGWGNRIVEQGFI